MDRTVYHGSSEQPLSQRHTELNKIDSPLSSQTYEALTVPCTFSFMHCYTHASLSHLGMVAFGSSGIVPVGTVTGVELVPSSAEHLAVIEVCDTFAQRSHQLNRAVRESATLLKMMENRLMYRRPCWMVKVQHHSYGWWLNKWLNECFYFLTYVLLYSHQIGSETCQCIFTFMANFNSKSHKNVSPTPCIGGLWSNQWDMQVFVKFVRIYPTGVTLILGSTVWLSVIVDDRLIFRHKWPPMNIYDCWWQIYFWSWK